MTTKAKICGLSTPETVKTAFDGGAAYLGFVFFARSPRNVEPEAAQRLVEPVRGRGVQTVAVTVDPDDALIDRLMATMRPDLIQVHGKETPSRVREIAARSGVGVIKAFSVSTSADVDQARAYDTVAEQFLFDARPVEGQGGTSSLPGGTGARFDWSLLEGRRFSRPHFLAGGLDPWNVGAAVAASGAPLVDVSSGVERGPGLKDPALITAFLDAVRRA
ncbi:phosphoribosylanthranilate isomerase [Caulobacter endophyticus]|uniref:N-(5'-phosphoribosyl)anthranilate isomerase n=1 Tax=Caulobacter endophyticus TaxID=2172652 RepID=A0A2T9JQ55_9CAUL|nr:phosphoribosylanthranilate isomerase [Caulobacter endophyticus]PVM85818.1 phosphoribosylanthranilate isomerase [Caulobacter endophyticus]